MIKRATSLWHRQQGPKRFLKLSSHRLAIRDIVTLAIETSCDDTSVAIAELLPISSSSSSSEQSARLKVHFHEKITSNNDEFGGINPITALQSHAATLAPLIARALKTSPKPDLVAATRGPGMRSNLHVGLHTAKGLALAWDVPFIGVHHMQAHALTPRLVSAMNENGCKDEFLTPTFPFLSVLASGGHTMLIDSQTLIEHKTLAETGDISLGSLLDKAARRILPAELFKSPYGKALEDFAFPNGSADYHYDPPRRRQDDLARRPTQWKWSMPIPLAESGGGDKSPNRMLYTFAGLETTIKRFMEFETTTDGISTKLPRNPVDVSLEERQEMAREVQRVAFEHLASRVVLYLSSNQNNGVKSLVVSGGVASNRYLRHILRSILDVRGHQDVEVLCPPIALCTDNALMIAWAALEMWNAGHESDLSIEPIRTWSMDSASSDGGIIGVGGWKTRVAALDANVNKIRL
ncbi:peptidase M22, glycoprotease [Dissoconium aciculare CBS 342.82]|uniref:N(6)-L-threonylcarbamoyladenine synthase n=1 Tax=Dissoconium aciculare CBS 342.82 TaxID=1314786 RepID=A0A6J3MJ73_9PEZI|nr:peptidase M22, glycoprotease [Dissoconium aciculare CBS 342.82]KAF1827958.1 peptidase M22, glycoprotease [Dissoconium aciculare CBS 342.82]